MKKYLQRLPASILICSHMNNLFQKLWSLKIVKAAATGVIGFCIVLFGIAFGPGEQEVEAKVFEHLISYTRAMPGYLFDDKESSKPRKVKVNGNTTYLRVGRSKDDISRILDFYEEQYQPQPVTKTDEDIIKKISSKNLKEYIRTINLIQECMRPKQHFRYEGKDYGYWGTIEFHDSDLKLGSEEFIREYEKTKERDISVASAPPIKKEAPNAKLFIDPTLDITKP